MKSTFSIVLIALLIPFAPACEKTKTSRSYTENKLNGKVWESDYVVAGFIGDRMGLNFQKHKKIDGIRVVWDRIGLDNLKKILGKQRLYYRTFGDTSYLSKLPYALYAVPQDDGDVGCDMLLIYEADSVNNWVEITEQEDDFRHIKGRYSMTLTKWTTCDASVTADTVVIREGVFDVYLQNR